MSRLTAAWIPARGQHILASVCMLPDIFLFILEHCSPYDLVQLNATCRTFRGLIRDQPHLWDRAFYNMARGDSPALPPCPVIRSAGYSIPAYISWIFGGGPCSVRECENFSNSLPFDFVWGFRACSPDCRDKLTSEEYVYYDWNCNFRSLGMFAHLPRITVSYGGRSIDLYLKKAIMTSGVTPAHGAWASRRPPQTPVTGQDRQLLGQNALELENWTAKYLVEKKAVMQTNLDFILKQAKSNTEKAKEICRCETVREALVVFSRDLQLFTISVWSLLLNDIPVGLKEFIAARTVRQRCVDCPDLEHLFSPEALERHQSIIHPHRLVRQPCEDCPDISRVYTPRTLQVHRSNKHPDLIAILPCDDCPSPSSLFTPNELEAHQLHKHPHRVVMQPCDDCPVSSFMFTPSQLRKHRLAKHPASLGSGKQRCAYCSPKIPREFTKEGLRMHQLARHPQRLHVA
ncbi:hypothetical protein MIND_00689900 [Mycena indigotica]|uniref:F-box domain-containing protein n=1 Tax=Mycena indigotica TaxID=2126181 RepID=A0A8H6SKU7_9AGAR|nr:uncharacterized protein MIND_00689900 [Mycena indigotica]KAF7301251.1 hypothetical protein MIND_00689900 [Mycena indigotica]